jgi:hypothetical protein
VSSVKVVVAISFRGEDSLKRVLKQHIQRRMLAYKRTEARFVGSDPYSYIVCSVMGLDYRDPASWTTICGLYAELPKTIVTTTREERRARITFVLSQ